MQNHEVEVNSLRHECIECNEIARELKEKVAEDLELHAALLISQAHHHEVIFSASKLCICEQEELDAAISNSIAESFAAISNSKAESLGGGALAACNEREALELHAALLLSEAHQHEIICASRLSMMEQEDLDAAISNSKAEYLIVDALIQFDQEYPDANNIQHQGKKRSADLKISIPEEIMIAASEVYNNVETPL